MEATSEASEEKFSLRWPQLVHFFLKLALISENQSKMGFKFNNNKLIFDSKNQNSSGIEISTEKGNHFESDYIKASEFIVNHTRIYSIDSKYDTITLSNEISVLPPLLIEAITQISHNQCFKEYLYINECQANFLELPGWIKLTEFNTLGALLAALFESIISHQLIK